MYEAILEKMKSRPALYGQGDPAFWNDEHISKHMLAAHLDPTLEAASRQHTFIDASALWIAGLFPHTNGRKLLDLGCGPGLYAERFCKAGFLITGVDFSERSVAYARLSAQTAGMQIEYRYMNYLDIDFDNEFDIVTLIYCDFGVLAPADRQNLLAKVKKALKPGGLFILDGSTEHFMSGMKEKRSVIYADGGFWSPEPYLCLENTYLYPKTKNWLDQYIVITADRCRCFNIWNQAYSRDSLRAELDSAGFGDVRFFDDVCGKPFSGASDTICAAAERPGPSGDRSSSAQGRQQGK